MSPDPICSQCHGTDRVVVGYTGDPLGPGCNLVRPIWAPCPACGADAQARLVDEILDGVNMQATP